MTFSSEVSLYSREREGGRGRRGGREGEGGLCIPLSQERIHPGTITY
jgi:hypothetical protein